MSPYDLNALLAVLDSLLEGGGVGIGVQIGGDPVPVGFEAVGGHVVARELSF